MSQLMKNVNHSAENPERIASDSILVQDGNTKQFYNRQNLYRKQCQENIIQRLIVAEVSTKFNKQATSRAKLVSINTLNECRRSEVKLHFEGNGKLIIL